MAIWKVTAHSKEGDWIIDTWKVTASTPKQAMFLYRRKRDKLNEFTIDSVDLVKQGK